DGADPGPAAVPRLRRPDRPGRPDEDRRAGPAELERVEDKRIRLSARDPLRIQACGARFSGQANPPGLIVLQASIAGKCRRQATPLASGVMSKPPPSWPAMVRTIFRPRVSTACRSKPSGRPRP